MRIATPKPRKRNGIEPKSDGSAGVLRRLGQGGEIDIGAGLTSKSGHSSNPVVSSSKGTWVQSVRKVAAVEDDGHADGADRKKLHGTLY